MEGSVKLGRWMGSKISTAQKETTKRNAANHSGRAARAAAVSAGGYQPAGGCTLAAAVRLRRGALGAAALGRPLAAQAHGAASAAGQHHGGRRSRSTEKERWKIFQLAALKSGDELALQQQQRTAAHEQSNWTATRWRR